MSPGQLRWHISCQALACDQLCMRFRLCGGCAKATCWPRKMRSGNPEICQAFEHRIRDNPRPGRQRDAPTEYCPHGTRRRIRIVHILQRLVADACVECKAEQPNPPPVVHAPLPGDDEGKLNMVNPVVQITPDRNSSAAKGARPTGVASNCSVDFVSKKLSSLWLIRLHRQLCESGSAARPSPGSLLSTAQSEACPDK